MQVQLLRQFLHSLAIPLKALGVDQGIEETCHVLAHFQDMQLDVFLEFLKQAEDYRKSGKLATPTLHSMEMEKLQTAYRLLNVAIAEANLSAIGDPQEEVKRQLEFMAKSAGLKGSLKVDPKWAGDVAKQKKRELLQQNPDLAVSRVKALASKITSSEGFHDPHVKQEIADLSGIGVAKLKEIAGALNHKPTAKKADAFLIELLEKMTGTSSLDQRLVLVHVNNLKALHDKSTDSLPEAEIKEELKQLKALPIAELARVAEDFGLEKPGKTKPPILKRIESKIKATYNAKVANQV